MKMFKSKKGLGKGLPKFSIGKFLLFIVATFIIIAGLSLVLQWLMPDQTLFKEPSIPVLFFVIIVSAIIPFKFFVQDGKLSSKDWVGVLVYAAVVLLALMFLPEQFPQYFGDNVVLSDVLRNLWESANLFEDSVQSVLGLN